MNPKHTPGSWSVHFANDSINCNCKFVLSDVAPICVATIHVKENDSLEHSEYPNPDEAKANSKLISCAPELLDSLDNIVGFLEYVFDEELELPSHLLESYHNIIVNAQEIIKKATE